MSDALKRLWAGPAQIATWLVGMVVLFVTTPPRLEITDTPTSTVRLVEFGLTIVAGLCFVAFRGRAKARHAKGWGIASAVMLLAACASFGLYSSVSDRWTCNYDGHAPMVIGSTYLPEGDRSVAETPGIDCAELIANHAGRTALLWDRDELARRRLALIGMFSLTVTAFVLAALFMLQALRCGQGEVAPREDAR